MRDNTSSDALVPRAQFWKIDGKASLSQAFSKLGTLRMELTGQWSQMPLYLSEQLSLGSLSTIRGFNNIAAKVDRGAILRTEFMPTIPIDKLIGEGQRDNLPFLYDMLNAVQPYIFIDAGHGRQLAYKQDITRVGMGEGIRVNHGRIGFGFSIAHRFLNKSRNPTKNEPELYFSIYSRLL